MDGWMDGREQDSNVGKSSRCTAEANTALSSLALHCTALHSTAPLLFLVRAQPGLESGVSSGVWAARFFLLRMASQVGAAISTLESRPSALHHILMLHRRICSSAEMQPHVKVFASCRQDAPSQPTLFASTSTPAGYHTTTGLPNQQTDTNRHVVSSNTEARSGSRAEATAIRTRYELLYLDDLELSSRSTLTPSCF